MAVDLDPRVKRFQVIKAIAKAQAIAKKAEYEKENAAILKIMATSPRLSVRQARQVYEAHKRHQHPRTINVGKNAVKVFRV